MTKKHTTDLKDPRNQRIIDVTEAHLFDLFSKLTDDEEFEGTVEIKAEVRPGGATMIGVEFDWADD